MPDRKITFEIKEHLGTITRNENGWNKELNLISWNGGMAKYDIREWDEHHTRMSKGITLTPWEMRRVADMYITRNSERAIARGKAIEAERNASREAAYKQRATTAPEEKGPVDFPEPEPLQEDVANLVDEEGEQDSIPVELLDQTVAETAERATTEAVEEGDEPF